MELAGAPGGLYLWLAFMERKKGATLYRWHEPTLFVEAAKPKLANEFDTFTVRLHQECLA